MEPRTILEALGGYRAVAARLTLAPARVHNWTRRGIAREFWPNIVELAQEQERSDITFDVLRRAKPVEARRRAA